MSASSLRPPSSGESDLVLGELAEVLAARLRGGEPVDFETFLSEHPDQAERLRPLLPAIRMMADLGRSAERDAADLGDPGATTGGLGDFQILREIGRGGMGVVYEARQTSLNRLVALKVLPFAAALDPRRLQRFRNEAQAAAGLHHAHIVPVFAVGCERGVHYYAMQLIEGRSVSEVIRDLRLASGAEGSPPTEPRAAFSSGSSITARAFFEAVARLGIQAAEALEYAHSLGVVHRDVKPANLMLDALGQTWVADFGLAMLNAEAGLTMTGDILGTLRYMSPEQALARRGLVDQRTDIYSLGATLYELLTLHPALDAEDRRELLHQIAFEEPIAPRRRNPAIPRELETIVLKAMAKEPADRYAAARDLSDDLERWLQHRPIQARRPGPIERSAKWMRRHPAPVLATLAVLALAAVGLAVGLVAIERKQAELTRQRDWARRAVDQMYTSVAQEWLAHQPRMTPIQVEFLERSLAFYEEFARDPDTERSARLEAVKASVRLADIQSKLGRTQEAEAAYVVALGRAEALSAQHPGWEEPPALVQRLNSSFAGLLRGVGKSREAASHYGRALELAERLVAQSPANIEHRRALADALGNLGFLHWEVGQPNAAIAECGRAAEILEGLIAREGRADLREALTNTTINLGNAFQSAGRTAEAEKALLSALRHAKELAAESPGRPEHRENLVFILINLAGLQRMQGHLAKGEATTRQALVVAEALAEDFPAVPGHRDRLAVGYGNLGVMLRGSARSEEAEKAYRRAITILEELVAEHPETAEYRWHLANFSRSLGSLLLAGYRTAEAEKAFRRSLELLEKLATNSPGTGDYRDELAAALASLGELYSITDRPREATEAYRQNQEILEKLVAESPLPDHRFRLVQGLNGAGLARSATGDDREAAQAFRRALSLAETLVKEHPDRPVYRHDLATALCRLAWIAALSGDSEARDPKAALPMAQRATTLDARSEEVWKTLALARLRAGDSAGARAALDKVQSINPRPNGFSYFLSAWAFADQGDLDRAKAEHAKGVARTESKDHHDDERVRPRNLALLRDEVADVIGMSKPTSDREKEGRTAKPN